jgi:hypothetical protein
VQSLEEGASLEPEPGVEVGERLVEEEEPGPVGDRARERNPLLLAAGQLGGPPREHRVQPEVRAHIPCLCTPLRLRHPLDLQRVGDVVDDGHVRVERVVLEDHRDVSGARREPGDVPLADHDRA